MQPRISHLLYRIYGTVYNWPLIRPVHQRIEARSDFGWLGGIRQFLITQIHLPDFCVPTNDTQM